MDPLDDLLKNYASEPLPRPSEQFKTGVWNEIERRRKPAWTAYFGWADFLARPRLAAGALAVAVIIGSAPGIYRERAQVRQQIARESLHLDVFSARSPTLRASLFQSAALVRASR